ncbi:hypothetical protein QE152_g38218 [Popillia japonica]|uniref:Polyprotein n=1 Tax=Popillia japonica TaxID=7064 RepID=A0AAW1I8K6_POPJA
MALRISATVWYRMTHWKVLTKERDDVEHTLVDDPDFEPGVTIPMPVRLRQSSRERRPVRHDDYVTYLTVNNEIGTKPVSFNDDKLTTGTMEIGCDSQSAIALAKSDEFRARSKHIDVRHHYIREKVNSQSAIALAKSDEFRARSKHIDVRHHYIREKVNDLTIGLTHISTDHMVADLLTKALPKTKHFFCTKEMGLIHSIKN